SEPLAVAFVPAGRHRLPQQARRVRGDPHRDGRERRARIRDATSPETGQALRVGAARIYPARVVRVRGRAEPSAFHAIRNFKFQISNEKLKRKAFTFFSFFICNLKFEISDSPTAATARCRRDRGSCWRG